MQGNLSELDIRSILQLIELGQRTGELFVEAYSEPPGTTGTYNQPYRHRELRTSHNSWFVFFANGRIAYAAESPDSQLSRLRDYLHRHGLDRALDNVSIADLAIAHAPEYGCLWRLLERHHKGCVRGKHKHVMVGISLPGWFEIPWKRSTLLLSP